MIETLWRIEKEKRIAAAATGEGARVTGGRWTSPGRAAIYCAEHLSLAILEVLVHAPDPSQRSVPRVHYRLHVDRKYVETIDAGGLPADFSPRTPPGVTRSIGDAWLRESRTPVLAVPSAIVPAERNYILNPVHPEFTNISWDSPKPIHSDNRLWITGQ